MIQGLHRQWEELELEIRLGMKAGLGMRVQVGRLIFRRGRMDGWGCLIGGEGDGWGRGDGFVYEGDWI